MSTVIIDNRQIEIPAGQRLNGIQLGLINVAKNNASYIKILPIVNAHLK